jgi:hypothetical protein
MSWPIVGVIAAAVGLAAVLFGAWWLWWQLPKRQMRSVTAADRSEGAGRHRRQFSQDDRPAARRSRGADRRCVAYVQFTQQQQTAQRQFTEQQQASRDLLISNQVAKGFEQLGSDKTLVRLGGIYALEGVMNNSEQYHQPVLEALTAFVRDGTRTETGDGPPTTDIQAALTVIGRRKAIGMGCPILPMRTFQKST